MRLLHLSKLCFSSVFWYMLLGDLLYILELKVRYDQVKVNAMPSSKYKKKLSLFGSSFSCSFACLLIFRSFIGV